METQSKQTSEKNLIKSKMKEFIEETKEIFEQKAKQINSLIQSMRIEHNRLLSNSKLIFKIIQLINSISIL